MAEHRRPRHQQEPASTSPPGRAPRRLPPLLRPASSSSDSAGADGRRISFVPRQLHPPPPARLLVPISGRCQQGPLLFHNLHVWRGSSSGRRCCPAVIRRIPPLFTAPRSTGCHPPGSPCRRRCPDMGGSQPPPPAAGGSARLNQRSRRASTPSALGLSSLPAGRPLPIGYLLSLQSAYLFLFPVILHVVSKQKREKREREKMGADCRGLVDRHAWRWRVLVFGTWCYRAAAGGACICVFFS